jgi:hypothetical protein
MAARRTPRRDSQFLLMITVFGRGLVRPVFVPVRFGRPDSENSSRFVRVRFGIRSADLPILIRRGRTH